MVKRTGVHFYQRPRGRIGSTRFSRRALQHPPKPQRPHLLIPTLDRPHHRRRLDPRGPAPALAEAFDEHRDVVAGDTEGGGVVSVFAVVGGVEDEGEEGVEAFKGGGAGEVLWAGGHLAGVILFDFGVDVAAEGLGPLLLEDFVGGEGGIDLALAAGLGGLEVEVDVLDVAPAHLGGLFAVVLADVVVDRGLEQAAERALFAVGLLDQLGLEHELHEALGQVLGLVGPVPAATHVVVKRLPVVADDVGQGRPALRRVELGQLHPRPPGLEVREILAGLLAQRVCRACRAYRQPRRRCLTSPRLRGTVRSWEVNIHVSDTDNSPGDPDPADLLMRIEALEARIDHSTQDPEFGEVELFYGEEHRDILRPEEDKSFHSWTDVTHGPGYDYYGKIEDGSVTWLELFAWPKTIRITAYLSRFVNATYGHTFPGRTNYKFNAGFAIGLYDANENRLAFHLKWFITNMLPGRHDRRTTKGKIRHTWQYPPEVNGIKVEKFSVQLAIQKTLYRA